MKKFVKCLLFGVRFYRCFNCSLKDTCPRSLFFCHNGERYIVTIEKESD